MESQFLPIEITFSIFFLVLFSTLLNLVNSLILKPRRLRSKLRKQGIRGPPPAILLGNAKEIKKTIQTQPEVSKSSKGEEPISHNCSSHLFPFFEQWRQQYGSTFVFSVGNMQILHMIHPYVVKEIITCTSLDLGKPSYQHKERGPLLGQGILTSNGAIWAHQRKILAPELYMEKVKGMIKLMADCSIALVNSWKSQIESGGGVADIKIDNYMRSFSRDIIVEGKISRQERPTICGCQLRDSDMIRKMKTLTMVINESPRLYPPVAVISREALKDMMFDGIHVPKGVNIWTLLVTLHQDPDVWGPDAHEFNPKRLSNGVSAACKMPHVYMPFGVGPRTCLGQNFAMAELKILIALIASNFSLTLSPKYTLSCSKVGYRTWTWSASFGQEAVS